MARRIATGIAAALGAAALMVGATGTPALASTRSTSGTTGDDIDTWISGTYNYSQNHGGDDFGFDNNNGATIDMRWVKCSDYSVHGSTVYDIQPGEPRHIIGTNFLAGTCLRSQYRAYLNDDRNRSFSGIMHYNANFA
jgi:hypothetical protein